MRQFDSAFATSSIETRPVPVFRLVFEIFSFRS